MTTYSHQQRDAFSFTGNQAALASQKAYSAGIYGEQRFLIPNDNSYALAVVFPTIRGNFGVKFNYQGFINFNERSLGLAYARPMGKKIDLGIQFNYYGYHIPDYGNASLFNVEIGAIMHLTSKVNAGFQVYNAAGSKGDAEAIASVYRFGMGYDASENFFVSIEIIKEYNKPLNVVGGMQYQFENRFFIRGGILSESGGGFGGVGISWGNLTLNVSGNYHPQLGFSPAISLLSIFKRKG